MTFNISQTEFIDATVTELFTVFGISVGAMHIDFQDFGYFV